MSWFRRCLALVSPPVIAPNEHSRSKKHGYKVGKAVFLYITFISGVIGASPLDHICPASELNTDWPSKNAQRYTNMHRRKELLIEPERFVGLGIRSAKLFQERLVLFLFLSVTGTKLEHKVLLPRELHKVVGISASHVGNMQRDRRTTS